MSTAGVPPSLGPGARPVRQGQNRDRAARIAEAEAIRSHYLMAQSEDGSALNIGYDLGGVARYYSVPFDKMPLRQPARWLAYGGPLRAEFTGTHVVDTIRGTERLVGRQLSQQEVEACCMHVSRSTAYFSAGLISSVGIGLGMTTLGWSKMKFPFRKPQPLEQYDNFPSRYLPLLRGQTARILWHMTRANLYLIGSLFLVSPLFTIMGENVMTVGLYRDARTTEMMKSVAAKFRGSPKNRFETMLEVKTTLNQSNWESVSAANEYDGPDPVGHPTENGADTSYGGHHDDAEDTAYTDSTADTGMLSDVQMHQRGAKQPLPTAFKGNSAFQKKPIQQPQDIDESAPSDYFFDDALPTAGNDPDSAMPTRRNAGGSVWSRIRGRVSPSEPGNTKGMTPLGLQKRQGQNAKDLRAQAQANSDSGQSFSFSNSEQEKEWAKEQAQREFDLLVERERNGQDGTSSGTSSGGYGSGRQGRGNAWERRRNG